MPDLTPMTREEKFLNGDTDLTPITRREHFYAGTESELPEPDPITREEWFIQKYRGGGGGDITVESLSVTENGTYTAPSGKAYSPVEVNVPLPQNAYLLKSVNTPTPIASFNDGEEMVMPSLKVAIEPQQDLNGYDAPWVGGSGKNKLNPDIRKYGSPYAVWGGELSSNTPNGDLTLDAGTYTFSMNESVTQINVRDNPDSVIVRVYSTNVMTFTIDQRKAVKISIELRSGQYINNLNFQLESGSTATSFEPYSNICPISGWDEVEISRVGKNLTTETSGNNKVIGKAIKGFTYTFSIRNRGNCGFNLKKNNNSGNVVVSSGASSTNAVIVVSFTADEDFTIFLNGYGGGGQTFTDSAYDYQLEIGTTATTYSPYNGHTYTIDLDGTRYGGKLDVVNGIVTPAPYYASYNGETLTGEWISDRDKYEVGATPTIGAQVVNIGASGTPVSILPTAVKSLLGQNNIWADTGDITDAEYFSKEV